MTIKSDCHDTLIPAESCGAVSPVALPAFESPGHVVEREGGEEQSFSGFRRTGAPSQSGVAGASRTAKTPLTPEQELQKKREQAYVEGFAAGKSAGYDEGFALGKADGERQGEAVGTERAEAEAKQRFDDQLMRQGAMIGELSRQLVYPIAEQDEAITRSLAELSLSIAREVIGREINADSSHIETICREAILQLPLASGAIRVSIHPQDQPIVQKLCEELQGDWQIVPDQNMLPGGCCIETASSLVDASVEKRVALIAEQVAEQHLHTHAQTTQQQHESLEGLEQRLSATDDSSIAPSASPQAAGLSDDERPDDEQPGEDSEAPDGEAL
ncbi:flagellar assembly protein FliH [Aestuariirhabdus sp. LZHN29]|uniref:flagellar assembly protein FliH n=1 Tax=Aestuariirhabdus sp. LZHN29 TaxID=3417462 RepID=UPI003CEC04AF